MARRVTVIDKRHGLDDLKRQLKDARRTNVVIGITHAAGGEVLTYANSNEFGATIKGRSGTVTMIRSPRTHKLVKHQKAMTSKASWAYYANDYAVQYKGHKIPSRPFMRTYYDENLKKIGDFAANQFLRYFTTNQGSIDQVFSAIGLFVQNGIKNQIRTAKQWAVPNAPSTIRAKGSDKPLIDHGIMINNVTFDIRRGR